MAFRAAIFDLDGVLVDSARLHFIAWKRIADELGIGFDEQANEALKGVDRMGSLDHILMLGGRSLDTVAREELAARKNGYYLDALASMTEADVLPGARDLLARARGAGLALGVASASRNAATASPRATVQRSAARTLSCSSSSRASQAAWPGPLSAASASSASAPK